MVSGVSRRVKEASNCWVSNEIGGEGEWISFRFNKAVSPRQINIKFDSNLSKELMISLSHDVAAAQTPGIPPELVKDYIIEFYKEDRIVYSEEVKDNYMRLRIHNFSDKIYCDQVRIKVLTTNGDKYARIYEVRIYD